MNRELLEKRAVILQDKERRLCEKSFYNFFLRFWDIIEPATPLVNNWHIKYLCDLLQREAERIAAKKKKIKDIIINIPPRSLKSSIITKAFNAWVWIHWPWIKFISSSYNHDLSVEHSVSSRRIMLSERYQAYWGHMFKIVDDQNLKEFYENSKTGYRMSISVGKGTGKGGNIFIIDDPLNAQEEASEQMLKNCIRWFDQVASTRLNNPAVDIYIIIMQRLSEEDLTGHVLDMDRENYTHICIPGEEDDNISPPELISHYKDGLFFGERFDRPVLDRLKLKLGDYGYSGQIMQRPSPGEGGKFKKEWWKFWVPQGSDLAPPKLRIGRDWIEMPMEELPDFFDDKVDSWDFAFKGEEDKHDNVAGNKWAVQGVKKYLLDREEGHFDFLECLDKVKTLRGRDARVSATLIEDKANGPAIINVLSKQIPGIIPIPADRSTGGKMARAMPVSDDCRAGNVYLPHPSLHPWVLEFVKHFADFPKNPRKKGDIDATAQAFDRFLNNKRVIPAYSSLNPHHRGDDKIDVGIAETRNYDLISTIHHERDLSLSIAVFFWDRKQQHLYIIREFYIENSMLDDLKIAYASVDGKSSVYVSKDLLMEQQSVAKMLKKEAKIRIRESGGYDEIGAIALANRMFQRNKITVNINCVDTDRQLMTWSVERGRPSSTGNGLAKCLLYVLCELRQFITWDDNEPKSGYRKESRRTKELFTDKGEFVPNREENQHGWLLI